MHRDGKQFGPPIGARARWAAALAALSAPVDAASLGVVRIALGAIGLLTAVRIVAYGWIDSLYAGPTHRFTYAGFGWVPQPGVVVAHGLVVVLGLAGVAVAVGWHTRPAVLGLLVSFAWIELVDVTTYLNHYWFVTLLATLCLVAPVDRALSLDARRAARPRSRDAGRAEVGGGAAAARAATTAANGTTGAAAPAEPAMPGADAAAADTAAAGTAPGVARGWVWLIRFQVGVVYTFAGLAKLNADWLGGLPLRLWLPARGHGDLALVGPLLDQRGTAQALAIAGAAFDCSIVALLLVRRTRLPAWCALVAFHITTWLLFPIGVFPWLMIAASTIYFAPSWPRVLWAKARSTVVPVSGAAPLSPPSLALVGAVGAANRTGAGHSPTTTGTGEAGAHTTVAGSGGTTVERGASSTRWRRRALAVGVAGWVVVQLALPLRHFAYPGDYRWTGQGYRFSWNVLLTEKSGSVTFEVTEPSTGRRWIARPDLLYTSNQLRVMASEPDLIHQAARTIAADERKRGHDVEVHVDAWLSLNGRPATRLIDPTVDLAAEPLDPWPDDWILPPGVTE